MNADLWKQESDIETRSFLKYLYCYEATDNLTKEIENKVVSTKLDEIFRNDYLSMNLHEFDIRREARLQGVEEGKLETAKNAILAEIPLETVAKICNLPLEQVQKLSEELK